MASAPDRLERQLRFAIEIDKLKSVLRQSYLTGEGRRENSAEHSWHIALLGLILIEHANGPVDALRVLKMLLLHDVVEIDAGDTYCYDELGAVDKVARERRAADRIFGMLPADQAAEFRGLWEEFEAAQTAEAKLAAAVDRFMPLLHNYHTRGRSWQEHGITRSQVLAHNRHMREGSEQLWNYARAMIEDAVKEGHLSPL